ncbi:uncharacterized protein LOC110695452 [Chenopodium quinoa]|uniref:uncharacterized protein LOC110695452 n=1 Tax=Chenopodium quinoa TaxID=63459 RepID=UPI000B7894CB|nr:uncharacterized protein LOC110695452 [Chenopodium quinoa]
MSRYERFEMQSKESIEEMFTRFNDIINELNSLGRHIPIDEQARKILRSLPQDERWRSKVTAMQEAKDFTKFNMEQLAGSLMTHELHLSSNTESSKNKSLALKAQDLEESEADEDEMAMLVRKFKRMMNYKKSDRNKKYESSRNTTCFKCGSKDHFIKYCPLPDGEKGKTKVKGQSKDSRVYKPYFTKDNVKKAMLAAWGVSDSEEEEDQPLEETAHLCLMAKTDEKEKMKELESDVWFSKKELRHFSKENLIFVVLEIPEELKELHRAKQQSDEALVKCPKKEKNTQKNEKHFPVRGNNTWYLYSGFSKHMTGDKSRFFSVDAYYGGTVTFGDNMTGDIVAIGKVGRIIHNDTGNIILEGTRKGNTYVVDLNKVPNRSLTCLSVIEDDPLLWHKRFGHASFTLLDKLRSKELVEGLPCIKFLYDKVCDACVRGKQTRVSFKSKKMVSTKRPLELIHMDLCGPMRIQSRSGKRYVMVIVDDFSRFTLVFFLVSKDEIFDVFVAFVKKEQRRTGNP